MDYFKDIVQILGTIAVIVVAIIGIKMTEGGWRKVWKFLLIVLTLILAYRSYNLYAAFEERKNDQIDAACNVMSSTYDNAACLRLKN